MGRLVGQVGLCQCDEMMLNFLFIFTEYGERCIFVFLLYLVGTQIIELVWVSL